MSDLFNLVIARLTIMAPVDWSDQQSYVATEEIGKLLRDVESMVASRLETISPDLKMRTNL